MAHLDLHTMLAKLQAQASAHGLSVVPPATLTRLWLRREEGRLDTRIHQQSLAASGIDVSTRARLVVWEGRPHERVFLLTDEPVLLGRGADCEVRLWSDSKVSRRHCRVFLRDEHFILEDCMSAGGTLLGDAYTATQYITTHPLRDGETIWVGETPVRFRLPQ